MTPTLRSGRRLISCARRMALALLVVVAVAPTPGCVTLDLESVRRVADAASWTKSDLVTVRKTPSNPLEGPLNLLSNKGPRPSQRTEQVLRRYDLAGQFSNDPDAALDALRKNILVNPIGEQVYAYAELAYVTGKKSDMRGDTSAALDMYGASVAHAYYYLFDPAFDNHRNPYDPQFRQACDLYNAALEGALRIVDKMGKLQPGKTHTIETGEQIYDVDVVVRGRWDAEEFERFEFVSDYELTGLKNHHQTHGLGVPLMAIRKQRDGDAPSEKYYPRGLTFPITAFLRVVPWEEEGQQVHYCTLELWDPLAANEVELSHRLVPLESDLSTPLAYFLNDPLVRTQVLATFALLKPEISDEINGLYMLEPYDPRKIPVVMVHGLWSSPVTWMEMFNDLRAMPDIRENYQFWFYLYPTGQPFWISAAQMRHDLAVARQDLDPQRKSASHDQMVLVGHSMGGLVSRLQTIDSGNDFWKIVSDKPFAELKADDATREKLAQTMFFRPNRSVRRVITMGTPHRGSHFANSATRWISQKLITLPSLLVSTSQQVVRDNPGVFRDSDLLEITTSIDSLAPDSPVFPVMQSAQRAPWVTYHNVVGRAPQEDIPAKFSMYVSGEGDGIVALDSARVEDAVSEIEVPADHTGIHRHPRAILEVRRILLEHLVQVQAERQRAASVERASYLAPDTMRR